MAAPSAAADPLKGTSIVQKYSDVLIAVAIVTIVIMMIIALACIFCYRSFCRFIRWSTKEPSPS